MAIFTESFNKADSVNLGVDLTWSYTGTQWATVANRGVIYPNTSAEVVARAEHDTGSNDMYVELVIPDFGTSSYCDIGLCVRMSADRQSYYCFKRGIAGGTLSTGFYELRKYVNGVLVSPYIFEDIAQAFSFPETSRIEIEGSEIRLYVNGVLVNTAVDTDIPTGSFGGLNGYRNSTSDSRRVIFDDFKVGALGDSEPPVPPGFEGWGVQMF